MNKVQLIGRFTKEPEIKLTSNQIQFCNFVLAVDRRFKDANGNRQTDFISCVAWKQTAVFIQKYFHKGNKIAVAGSIQTRTSEDQQGNKKYFVEVIIEEAEFVESQIQTQPAQESSAPQAPAIQIQPVEQESVGGLPFEI